MNVKRVSAKLRAFPIYALYKNQTKYNYAVRYKTTRYHRILLYCKLWLQNYEV